MATVVLLLLQMSEAIHERRKEDRIVTTPLIIRTGLSSHDGDRKTFEEITSTQPPGAPGSVASMLSAIFLSRQS